MAKKASSVKTSKKPSVKSVARLAKSEKPDLHTIFNAVKSVMSKYEKGLDVRDDSESCYELWGKKDFEFMGRKRKGIQFAALLIQSTYVGFYYMPVYCHPDIKKIIGADLLRTLKGKACFHIKSTDDALMKQIGAAMKIGCDQFRKNKWI